jgi:hypothetical protein
MTTQATKTRALCVATRCTSVDQFVAAFHRFCGDDQTFFVATMTSRPIGLETAFSIQLVDKQPVLRGLCVVLDAWATPENRYKRPGIRLGIKRLTPESQIVFDRLTAAARAPGAVADATPLPAPLPVEPPPPAPVLRPPAFSLRTGAMSPPMPRLSAPSDGLPPIRSTIADAVRPRVPVIPPIRPQVQPPIQPPAPAVPPPAVAPDPVDVEARAEPAADPGTLEVPESPAEAAQDASSPEPAAGSTRRRRTAPVTVTRFQVALNVGAEPPPVDGVEFNPTELVPRARVERTTDAPVEPVPSHDTMPNQVAAEPARAPAPEPAPAADLRTPGSAFVLPANPLHNLSDESLEGFVDCTLYEETANIFHPAIDGSEWNDELIDPPAAPLATRATPASVPAMPFDTPPDLVVRSRGNTESLRVRPDDPSSPAEPAVPPPAMAPAAPFAPPQDLQAPGAGPWLGAPSDPYGQAVAPELPHLDAPYPEPSYLEASHSEPAFAPGDPVAHGHAEAAPPYAAYPAADATQYAHHGAAPPGSPPGFGVVGELEAAIETAPVRIAPAWQRWLMIGGSAVIAIAVAFVIARWARGASAVEPAPVGSAQIVAPRTTPAPAGSAAVLDDDADTVSEPPPSEDDGEAVSGGTPIVGSGPCRFTVATTPAGSMIRFDDQALGPSPLTIDGSCDKHKVEASHARYQSLTRWVTLVADKPQQLDLSLPRPVHAVTVTSFPPGAELSIDGHRAGTTPAVVQVMGFASVHLTFTKPGFKSVTRRIYSKLPQDRVFVKLLR